MKQTLPLGIVGILFITLALNGCSTATPIVSEWRNPAQTWGSFQRLSHRWSVVDRTNKFSSKRSCHNGAATGLIWYGNSYSSSSGPVAITQYAIVILDG